MALARVAWAVTGEKGVAEGKQACGASQVPARVLQTWFLPDPSGCCLGRPLQGDGRREAPATEQAGEQDGQTYLTFKTLRRFSANTSHTVRMDSHPRILTEGRCPGPDYLWFSSLSCFQIYK